MRRLGSYVKRWHVILTNSPHKKQHIRQQKRYFMFSIDIKIDEVKLMFLEPKEC